MMTLKDKFANFLSHYNVYKQLTTIFICAVLLPTLLIGSILSFYSCQQIITSYKELTASDAMRSRSILLNITNDLYNISQTLKNDAELNNLLSVSYPSRDEAIRIFNNYPGLKKIINTYPSISSLKIYVPSHILPSSSVSPYFTPIDDTVVDTDWYIKATGQGAPFWRTKERQDRYHNTYSELNFFVRLPIYATGEFAILNMSVSNNYLRSLIESSNLKTFICVNEDPIFYATLRPYIGLCYPIAVDYECSSYKVSDFMLIDGHYAIGSICTLAPYHCQDKLYILSADLNAINHIARITLSFITGLFISLFLSFLIIYFFTKYFSQRIQMLRLAMHKVSNNDYELVSSIHGDDELSEIFLDLKTMVDKVKVTESKVYKARIHEEQFKNQQQQMELKLLAGQINPHFLYNTLETIRMKAFAEGNREVANAIKLLGKSMRYVLNNTTTTATTLDKEIDYIKTYLAIQKLRFGSRLEYEIHIDQSLDPTSYKILPLILQPVVENAISHGIEQTGQCGMLTLTLAKEGELAIITIQDNGIGMDESELTLLSQKICYHDKEDANSIGLYNINQRIKLFYGNTYGINISSKKNKGTSVTITLPLYHIVEEEQ